MQDVQPLFYCLLSAAVAVLAVLALHNLFRRARGNRSAGSNEYAGLMFGAISLTYSLLMAFVVVAVWEDYEELNQTMLQETDGLSGIVIHAAALPDSLRRPMNETVARYCRGVIAGWHDPVAGSGVSGNAITDLRLRLLQVRAPELDKLLEVLDDDLDDISDLRRERLDHVRSHVPALVWTVAIVSSILMIVFSFFIHTDSSLLRRSGMIFLSALIAMSIFLVYALDHPFAQGTGISPAPYEALLRQLPRH